MSRAIVPWDRWRRFSWKLDMSVHQLDPRRTESVASAQAAPLPPSHRPRRAPWGWLALAFAVAAAAGAGGWYLLRPVEVRVARVGVGEAVDAVYASGVVEYVRQARVASVVTAPIQRVFAEEGQDVAAGQPLAQLDDGPQVGTTLQLEAQAAQARAVADRAQRLLDAGFGARAANEDAQAQRRAAEAAAASARSRLADYRIKAPFRGRVLRRDAEPGDLATAGQPLFVVADLGSVRVTADVDERDMARLAAGQDAVVRADAFPGQTFAAKVSEITPQGDSTGRVFRVRLALPVHSPLKPGMTVETNLIAARRANAVLVPSAALSRGGVWVVEGSRTHRRAIRAGAAGADFTEVAAGLAPGAVVVLNPSSRLRENGRVSVSPGG